MSDGLTPVGEIAPMTTDLAFVRPIGITGIAAQGWPAEPMSGPGGALDGIAVKLLIRALRCTESEYPSLDDGSYPF